MAIRSLYADVLRYLQRRPVSGTTGSGIFSNYNAANNPYLTDFNNTGITNTTTAAPIIAPIMQATGGGGSVYSLAGARTSDDYNPYAYRRTIDKGSTALALYPEFYGLGQKQLPGIMGTAVDFIKSKLPVNPRAILENELLGKGFAIDDVGRIVGDPSTAEGIMAGYNAAKITDETFDKRRERIQKTISEKKAKGLDTSVLENRLDLLDEAEANMLGARGMTKDILSDRYGEIDKYQFTGPNVQGNFYTSIKDDEDDEDDEDENYPRYDYDYESFSPKGSLYLERGLQAAEDTRLQQKLAEERLQREREKAALQKRLAEEKAVADRAREKNRSVYESADRQGFTNDQGGFSTSRADKAGTSEGSGQFSPSSSRGRSGY